MALLDGDLIGYLDTYYYFGRSGWVAIPLDRLDGYRRSPNSEDRLRMGTRHKTMREAIESFTHIPDAG